jgi:hypothetical protein
MNTGGITLFELPRGTYPSLPNRVMVMIGRSKSLVSASGDPKSM